MSKIPILGIPFDLDYVTKVDSEDNQGETDGAERKMKVKKGLKDDLKHFTKTHEIAHAILYISGQSEHLTEAQEEAIVIAIENGFAPLIEYKEEYK